MSPENRKPATTGSSAQHSAGLFDIRNVIGGLMLVYGVILVVTGLVSGQDHHLDNLWTGIGVLVVGVVFVAWALAKPTVVPDDPENPQP